MATKKILWLCSWYPDLLEPVNGDFIQRHAMAASGDNDIHVIHVALDPSGKYAGKETQHQQSGLTEHIIYCKKKTSIFGRLSTYAVLRAYINAAEKYIKEKGVPSLIHVQVPYPAGIAAEKLSRKYNIPYIVTEHWTIYQPQSPVQYKKQSWFFKWSTRSIIRHARLLLPVSNNLGQLINEQVADKPFKVLDNVADENAFFYEMKTASPEKHFRFIHISNFTYQKNVESIIPVFVALQQMHRSIELWLVGPVPPSLQAMIENTGLLNKNIFLKGEIAHTAVPAELKKADALVMFSRFENCPCTIIEALCCGLPVITSRVGGIPELINDTNGILVAEGDAVSLQQAMHAMVTDYTRYNGAQIASLAHERFSYQVVSKKLDKIYDEVIAAY